MPSLSHRHAFCGLVWLLIFTTVPFSADAKKKNTSKDKTISYKELTPGKKLITLANLILSGQAQSAAERLLETGDLKLDNKLKNRLHFIQAYLQLMSGNAKNAAELFGTLQGKYPEVESILPYWTARAERLAGNSKKALTLIEASCAAPCRSPARVAREYALSLCESGETARAQESFGELLAAAEKGMDRAFIQIDFIECKMKTGNLGEAYQDLRSLYTQAPAGIPPERLRGLLSSLHQGLSSLPSEFSADDELGRIRSLRAQERWVEAAQGLKTFFASLDPASQSSLRTEAAEIFFKARSYREAAEQYEKLSKEAAASGQDLREILEKLASAYARSNQFDKAIETQMKLEGSSEESSPMRSYKIAFLKADAGRCEEAAKAFQEFLDRYPKSNKRDDALWQRAWCFYQLKKYDAALRDFDQLESEFPRSAYSPRVAYWRYRVLEAAGRSSEANEAKQALIGKYGQGFYQRWDNQYGKSSHAQCPTAEGGPPAKNEPNLSSGMFGSRSASESSTLRELLSLGLWEDFLDHYRKGNGSSLTLGDMNDQMGEWIRFVAEAEQVPPELVWAVMREESHFKPKAFSSAGAIGLMQIIPQTGFEIAQSLKLSSFDSDDLFQPLINVRFGVHYLGLLLKKFSGNMVQAIAAYNAGPEAVERWQGQRPASACDEFIEQIPYRETNNYVKKVMRTFWDYRDNPSAVTQASNE